MADLVIVEASIAAAADATIIQGTSGATVLQGQPVYLNSSNQYVLADTDLSAAAAVVAGISLNSTTSGQPIDLIAGGTLTVGGSGVAVGTVYVLSGVAGKIADVADLANGDFTTVLGIGLTSSTVKIGIIVGGVAKA